MNKRIAKKVNKEIKNELMVGTTDNQKFVNTSSDNNPFVGKNVPIKSLRYYVRNLNRLRNKATGNLFNIINKYFNNSSIHKSSKLSYKDICDIYKNIRNDLPDSKKQKLLNKFYLEEPYENPFTPLSRGVLQAIQLEIKGTKQN